MPTYRITDPATGRTLKVDGPSPPSEAIVRQMFAQAEKVAPAPPVASVPTVASPASRSGVDRAAELLPIAGGTIGGFVGGIPGAALGGAAGEGFKQVIQQAGQIPGAIVDVARNLIHEPVATVKGFAQGASGGAKDAAVSGAVQGGLEAGGALAMKGASAAGKAVYRGYLKPSLAGHAIKDAQQIVRTALDEGLSITGAGAAKAQKIIGELKGEVDRLLQNTTGEIDLHEIADRVRGFARRTYKVPGRPVEDFAAAMKVADNIDAHPALGAARAAGGGPIPVSLTEANATKRALQQSAGDRAFGVERAAGTEAEKHGAFRLRKAIEDLVPEVGALNARESKLIDTAKAISHAVEREANQNALVGVKSVLSAGAGGMEYGRTGDPYSAAAKALALRAALTPQVASKMAIVAYRMGKQGGIAPASAARLALAAMALNQDAQDEGQ